MFRFSLDYQEATAEEVIVVDEPQVNSESDNNSPLKFQLIVATDRHLFGYLSPCSYSAQGLVRIDLWKIKPRYTVGRCPESNTIVLPGFKISHGHCIIEWSGEEHEENYRISVHDLSSNGTWINGVRIGKGKTSSLRDGDEICFGTCLPQPQNGGVEDYRYIYRHVPVTGVGKYYKTKEDLGSGAFGKVKRIVHRETKLSYAVKRVSVKQCVNEIVIMERLDHPRICKLFEHFEDESGKFWDLVMEYVDGGTLFEYIFKADGGHPLSDDFARSITEDIQNGMHYIHSHGITHRDLKTENILLTSSNPPKVKITDFGLSKACKPFDLMKTRCGTVSCCAPEILTPQKYGGNGYTNLVDSWNMGVIVYEMLAGQFLFPEGDRGLGRTQEARLEECGTSEDALDFLSQCLVEDPRDRESIDVLMYHKWILGHREEAAKKPKSNVPDNENAECDNADVALAPILEEDSDEQDEEIEVDGFYDDWMSVPVKHARASLRLKEKARDSMELYDDVGPRRSTRRSKVARVRATQIHSKQHCR